MKIGKYFTTIHIIEGLIIALSLSAFIYIEHFNLLNGYLLITVNSILALFGLYRLLKANTPTWFFSGFFIGALWLWWMAISFIHYKLPYLVPVSLFLIALAMGLIFLFLAFVASYISRKIENKFPLIEQEKTIYFLRSIALIALVFIEPFGFNWLKLLLIFTDSAFGLHLWQFALILFALSLYLTFKKWYLLLLIIFAIDLRNPKIIKPNTLRDIELTSTNIKVEEKWLPKNRAVYTKLALKKIDNAIAKNKKLIILPESLLPYFLNLEQTYLKEFLERSKKITIVVGSLYFISQNNYKNSAYIIKNGSFKIANKVILVPFGETNPLPKWMGSIVNKIFFDGAVDYGADKDYTYINTLGKRYKIAICYEGTKDKTYQDCPKYLILISNNGWFIPSIEPTLQQILLKYYATIYKTTIYHSINGSKSYVVVPHPED